MRLHITSSFFILLITANTNANATTKEKNRTNEIIKPCMNIEYSPYVIDCMIKKQKKTKKEYNDEFKVYLKSKSNQNENNKETESIINFSKRAKDGWDLYAENECLAEASYYEKNNDGYNAKYNICLIDKYSQRIEYYRENNK